MPHPDYTLLLFEVNYGEHKNQSHSDTDYTLGVRVDGIMLVVFTAECHLRAVPVAQTTLSHSTALYYSLDH